MNEHKNPNWKETDDWAIYKHTVGDDLGTTEINTGCMPWSEQDLHVNQ